MTVSIRRLEARDKEHWLGLFRGYVEFYRATVADDVIETLWQRLMAGGEGNHVGFVAVGSDDSPLGLAHILFHRATWTTGWYCYLEDLYVRPDCRGQGAGLALIEAVYAEADRHGAARTYWVTEEDNHTARALYDRVARRAPYVQYRR